MTIGQPLVIGYGNPLRGDDAVGHVAAEAIAADPRFAGVTVLTVHQLAPEIADDVASATRLVIVDARDDGSPAGTVHVAEVLAEAGEASLTHHVTAGSVLALAAALYGQAPRATVVTVAIADTDTRDGELTPLVAAAVPHVVDIVAGLVLENAHA